MPVEFWCSIGMYLVAAGSIPSAYPLFLPLFLAVVTKYLNSWFSLFMAGYLIAMYKAGGHLQRCRRPTRYAMQIIVGIMVYFWSFTPYDRPHLNGNSIRNTTRQVWYFLNSWENSNKYKIIYNDVYIPDNDRNVLNASSLSPDWELGAPLKHTEHDSIRSADYYVYSILIVFFLEVNFSQFNEISPTFILFYTFNIIYIIDRSISNVKMMSRWHISDLASRPKNLW